MEVMPGPPALPKPQEIQELLPGAPTLINTSSFACLAAGGVGLFTCGTCGNLDPSWMEGAQPT